MSDLAYNANGEPFELPEAMAGWRVRKLKAKGAPEVVYGRDGLPLFLPVEADIEDVRREAREVGRYRLDPVDDRKRAILNAEASYVCVPSVDLAPDPAAASHAAVLQVELLSRLIDALLESQKQHAELARMYVSQFPVIVDALCSVIRAAGYAGLPQRATHMVPVMADAAPPEHEHGSDIDDDEGDERGEAKPIAQVEPKDSWPKVLQSLLDHVGPSLGRLVSGLSGLGGDAGARVNEPVVRSPEPQLARGGEELVASRAELATLVHLDAIAAAKDAAHGAAPGSAPLHEQSSGADAQASQPRAQDRDRTSTSDANQTTPDADQKPGKRRDGWGLMAAPEPNGGAVAHVRARPDMPGPDIARADVAAGDRGVVSGADVTSLTAEGPGSDRNASTSAAHESQVVSSRPETSRPNRSTLHAEPVVSRMESFLAQALLAKPTTAPTSSDSLVQAHTVGVGDELAPPEVAAMRGEAAAPSPAGRDQRAAPTPTLPTTSTARQTQAATVPTVGVGEIPQAIADRQPSTDTAAANATASRDLSGGEPSRTLSCSATAPPLPGAGPPMPQEDAVAASDPDPRWSRARSEPDADEKQLASASAIRNGDPSRTAAPQPVSSVAAPVSGPSQPPGSTGQYEVWPQTTQTRDLLQAFVAAFRSLLADRTPVYLSPPMDMVSVSRCQEN